MLSHVFCRQQFPTMFLIMIPVEIRFIIGIATKVFRCFHLVVLVEFCRPLTCIVTAEIEYFHPLVLYMNVYLSFHLSFYLSFHLSFHLSLAHISNIHHYILYNQFHHLPYYILSLHLYHILQHSPIISVTLCNGI